MQGVLPLDEDQLRTLWGTMGIEPDGQIAIRCSSQQRPARTHAAARRPTHTQTPADARSRAHDTVRWMRSRSEVAKRLAEEHDQVLESAAELQQRKQAIEQAAKRTPKPAAKPVSALTATVEAWEHRSRLQGSERAMLRWHGLWITVLGGLRWIKASGALGAMGDERERSIGQPPEPARRHGHGAIEGPPHHSAAPWQRPRRITASRSRRRRGRRS